MKELKQYIQGMLIGVGISCLMLAVVAIIYEGWGRTPHAFEASLVVWAFTIISMLAGGLAIRGVND